MVAGQVPSLQRRFMSSIVGQDPRSQTPALPKESSAVLPSGTPLQSSVDAGNIKPSESSDQAANLQNLSFWKRTAAKMRKFEKFFDEVVFQTLLKLAGKLVYYGGGITIMWGIAELTGTVVRSVVQTTMPEMLITKNPVRQIVLGMIFYGIGYKLSRGLEITDALSSILWITFPVLRLADT